MRFLFICVWILNLYGQAPSTNDYERLATRISKGDSQAILAAGSSADVRFLPILRTTVSRYSKRDKAVADDARLALARLGDQHEIEAVLCELHGDDPYVQTRALRDKLRYIGGWVSINALRDFLPDTPENQKGTGVGDLAFGSRTHVAISVLRDLLPAGPAPDRNQRIFTADDDRKQARAWQKWIEKHKRELMELKPVGNYQPAGCFQDSPEKELLRGMVFDHTGSVVPDVNVEIRALPSGASAPSSRTGPPALTLRTGREGDFSAELAAGSYQVCVSRFPKSCQTVEIQSTKPPEYLRLKIDPSDLQRESIGDRIRAIAGPGAKNCGHVPGEDDPSQATKCALRAVKQRKAFYVSYDEMGFEGWTAAMAGDSSGNVYSVNFDPMAYELEVTPCSKPVRVRATKSGVTRRGVLTCFAEGRWLAQ